MNVWGYSLRTGALTSLDRKCLSAGSSHDEVWAWFANLFTGLTPWCSSELGRRPKLSLSRWPANKLVAAETLKEILHTCTHMHAQGCHSLSPQHTQKHTVCPPISLLREKKKLFRMPSSHLRASLYTPIHNTLQISSLPPLSSLSFFPSHPCPVPVTINSTPCTQTHTRKPQRDTNSTNTENSEPTPAAVGEEEKRTREKCGETTDTRNRRSLNILFHTIKQLAQCWGESLTVWVRDKHRRTSVTALLPSPQARSANIITLSF